MRSMLIFAVPMILGNLLQQCYNIADTLIVGQFLGRNALAAVGSSFSLPADGFVCRRTGDGGYFGRRPLPAYRRRVLLWDRMPVSAVWFIQGVGEAWDERGAHCHLPGNKGGVSLYIVGGAVHRCGRHLVVGANRLGVGGCGRHFLLHTLEKNDAIPSFNSYFHSRYM